jgi:hypothetical protein
MDQGGVVVNVSVYPWHCRDPADPVHSNQWWALDPAARRLRSRAAGPRYNPAGDSFCLAAGLPGQEAKVEVGLEPLTAVGARLGGGLLVEKGIVYAELAVAETLTPAPSNHHLGLELGVEVKPQIAVRAGLELEKRAFAGEIDGAALEIEESLQALMLGVTYTLR